MKKLLQTLAVLITVSIVLSACGGKDNNENDDEITFSDHEFVDDEQVVVTVNDIEIFGLEYNYNYMFNKVQMHQFRQDTSDLDTIKTQTLDGMIDQEILTQEAEKAGIEVSDEVVDEQIDLIKEEAGDETFHAYLDQYGLTEEDYKKQAHFTLLQEEYVKAEIPEVQVSDEEIKETYDMLKETSEDFPDFEEMAERIEVELTSQKEWEMLVQELERLREEAEIEIFI